MDDREMFANRQVFPDADQVIVGDMERIGDYVSIRPQDYVCVMTRGHQFDYYVQKQALALKPCYLGVMGSKNKIRVVTERLLEDGFSKRRSRPAICRSVWESMRKHPGDCSQRCGGDDL